MFHSPLVDDPQFHRESDLSHPDKRVTDPKDLHKNLVAVKLPYPLCRMLYTYWWKSPIRTHVYKFTQITVTLSVSLLQTGLVFVFQLKQRVQTKKKKTRYLKVSGGSDVTSPS